MDSVAILKTQFDEIYGRLIQKCRERPIPANYACYINGDAYTILIEGKIISYSKNIQDEANKSLSVLLSYFHILQEMEKLLDAKLKAEIKDADKEIVKLFVSGSQEFYRPYSPLGSIIKKLIFYVSLFVAGNITGELLRVWGIL